jgi:hypothetical protein
MNKKSPIKDRPLRYAGQSLDERIDKLINEEAMSYFVVISFAVILAANEWWRYFNDRPPAPVAMTVLATGIFLFGAYNIRKRIIKVRLIKLGRDGERVVGQYLEGLREKGHRIFHDLLGNNFNLDHVMVSRKGIYVIETKTYSKPARGESKVRFDGEKLIIDGLGVQIKPITQVNSAAKWLKTMLQETTGKEFDVKPVILFPGWFIESTEKGKKSDTWVLNPKALPAFIDNQPERISQEDMMLASFHISRYIRTTTSDTCHDTD